jgi:hypothetical protein
MTLQAEGRGRMLKRILKFTFADEIGTADKFSWKENAFIG